MNAPVPRERQLRRARRAEIGMTLLAALGVPLVFLWPGLLAAYLGVITLSTVGLTLWQYRVMDEFRRARFLKAWAAAGVVGITALSTLIVWEPLGLPASGQGAGATPLPAVSFPLWALALPWLTSLATFLGVTAYLYRRDGGV